MKPTRPMPVPWTVRLRTRKAPRPSAPRPDAGGAPVRPGIAARWKPRDRVSAAGN